MMTRDPTPAFATESNLLSRVVAVTHQLGVIGEDRLVKLVYLAITSRLLTEPVSVVVKGASSAGKSFTTRRVVQLFPKEAVHELTAASERVLAYGDDKANSLKHRTLVFYEAAGIQGETGSYLMRSLLSEGRINYEVVEKGRSGQFAVRRIVREGPTNVILTTTSIRLHPENETRLLSIPANDTQEQTRNVMRATASRLPVHVDLSEWHALQGYLANSQRHVAIPFAAALAELIPPVATRLRRDFSLLLNLISAHALLHQVSREFDSEGAIVATLDDYEAIHGLVADLFAEGVEASLPPTVRETVESVAALLREGHSSVALPRLALQLGLDKSTVSRRVKHAQRLGYLRNLEERRGAPARLILGEPLPDDVEVLPIRDVLETTIKCCSVAAVCGGKRETASVESKQAEATR
jgi:hypothetical protein